jgi:pimeloyl-ACP methyl ester carboxylesterase
LIRNQKKEQAMKQFNRRVMLLAMTSVTVFTFSGCSNLNKSSGTAPVVQMTDAAIEVGTTKVAYRDSGGSGTPVVFLHAASGKSQMWIHQIPAFTAAGYRFIAIDWRHPNPGHQFASHSTLLIDAVLNKLGVQRAHLVGTAAGGGAALKYTFTHPAKVRSLTIANSTGVVTDPEYVQMTERIRPAPQFAALPLEFKELGPSYRAANPEGVERWKALASSFVSAEPTLAPPAGAARPGPGSNEAVTWAKLRTLTIPTLLLTGDADLYMPPSVLRIFTQHIKHAELEIVPDTGHSAYWEQPEIFNRRVLSFLRKH